MRVFPTHCYEGPTIPAWPLCPSVLNNSQKPCLFDAQVKGKQPRVPTEQGLSLATKVTLVYARGYSDCLFDFLREKRYRYVAYRQFVRWIWRYLGRKIRVVIPACAVSAIRKEFDSDSYKGFKLPDIQ
ncbi:hypothetical protein GWK47_052872 [Chionoecetes opilio]|uniref:P2X purinoreceptor 7 intracellular domain-containing protein n=1 Tax=Chionoecetes opilio TaxID=41210 RepID=A0A8J4Y8I2_CHIOP|nr:hypothetical protein GWK47_052872 [Chionoecetes opilio]